MSESRKIPMTAFGRNIIDMADGMFRGKTITRDEADEAIEYINRCVPPEPTWEQTRDGQFAEHLAKNQAEWMGKGNVIERMIDAAFTTPASETGGVFLYTHESNRARWRIWMTAAARVLLDEAHHILAEGASPLTTVQVVKAFDYLRARLLPEPEPKRDAAEMQVMLMFDGSGALLPQYKIHDVVAAVRKADKENEP